MDSLLPVLSSLLAGDHAPAEAWLARLPSHVRPSERITGDQQRQLLHATIDALETRPAVAAIIPHLFDKTLPAFLLSNMPDVCTYLFVPLPADLAVLHKKVNAVAAAARLPVPEFYQRFGHLILLVSLIHDANNDDTLLHIIHDGANLPDHVKLASVPQEMLRGNITEAVVYLISQLWAENKQRVMAALEHVMGWSSYRFDTLASYIVNFLAVIISSVNTVIFDTLAIDYTLKRRRALASLTAVLDLIGHRAADFMTQLLSVGQAMDEYTNDDGNEGYAFWQRLLTLSSAKECRHVCAVARGVLQYFPFVPDTLKSAVVADLTVCIKNAVMAFPATLHQLPALPPYDEMSDLAAWIADEKSLYNDSIPLDQLMSHVAANGSFEALTALYNYLCRNDTLSDKVWPHLATLYDLLLHVIKTNAHRHGIKDLAASCLGKLGAIDPNHLQSPSPSSTASATKQYTRLHRLILLNHLNDDVQEARSFALDLIERHLYPTYHATSFRSASLSLAPDNSTAHHCTQYSIQQVLRAIDLRSPTNPLWLSIHPDMQDFLSPFLVSNFSVGDIDVPALQFPLYATTRHAFREWLVNFYYYLCNCLQDLLPHAAFNLFEACRPSVATGNVALTQHLIPYMITPILVYGDTNRRKRLTDEVVGVVKGEGFDHEMTEGSLTVVVAIIEYCRSWIRQRQKKGVAKVAQQNEIRSIRQFLDTIPHDLMAKAAFRTKNYPLALMHLELGIKATLERAGAVTSDDLDNLCQIYIHMENTDAVTAVLAMYVKYWKTEHQILHFETLGHWKQAQLFYEHVLDGAEHSKYDSDRVKRQRSVTSTIHIPRNMPDDKTTHTLMPRYIHCLRQLGDYDRMMSYTSRAIDLMPHLRKQLNGYRLEVAWKTGNWNQLQKFAREPMDESSFDALIARALSHLQTRSWAAAYGDLKSAKVLEVERLTQAGPQSYHQALESVLRLQRVHDLESSVLLHDQPDDARDAYQKAWIRQFAFTSPLYRDQRALLDFQIASQYTLWKPDASAAIHAASNAMAPLFNNNEHGQPAMPSSPPLPSIQQAPGERDLWLLLAKTARKANDTDVALMATLHALTGKEKEDPRALIEHAKWYNAIGQTRPAIKVLEDPALRGNVNATLLRAKYTDNIGALPKDTQQIYLEARKEGATFEKPHFMQGSFYDRLADNKKHQKQIHRILTSVGELYVEALNRGSKYFYHTMPRLLSIWMQFAEEMRTISRVEDRKLVEAIKKGYFDMNNLMRRFAETAQPYQFGLILPRLVSRLTIGDDEVADILAIIITKVLLSYPKTTAWALQASYNSTDRLVRDRLSQIICNIDAMAYPHVLTAFEQARELTRQLSAVAKEDFGADTTNATLHKFPALLQMKHLEICVPLESALLPTLPEHEAMPYKKHDPYPADLPTIQGILPDVIVMKSLQAPKRFTFVASNGKQYHFLCKRNDDLRKDARTMEFSTMINTFLKKNVSSRQHQLYIRTYAVIPLGDRWGLIEWINNLNALKSIVTSEWQSQGIEHRTLMSQIRHLLDGKKPDEKTRVFSDVVLPRCPAVFYKWFLEHFPEPSHWFASRSRYVRSLAVMSIVGYVLGLGDRHAENLLFDATNGDTVHVDVNMIFDRGLNLTVPEIVPFRLTKNLLDAMGVTHHQGEFQKACQVTLEVLRKNRVQLLSVFETLAHDPIIDWRKKTTIPQEAALAQISKMANKIDSGRTIEQEVSQLISDASADKNLCQMFLGWAPYV